MHETSEGSRSKHCLAASRTLTSLGADPDPNRPYLVQLAEWAVANIPVHDSKNPSLQEHLDKLNAMDSSAACRRLACRRVVSEFESGSEPSPAAEAMLFHLLEMLTPSEMEALRESARETSEFAKTRFADLGSDTKV